MLQIPLLLTLFRLCIAPWLLTLVLIFFLPTESLNERFLIALLIALGGLTDYLDGYLARRWKQETELGRLLDPLADKFFVLCIAITLLALHMIPLWWALIVVGRELWVTALREIAVSYRFSLKVASVGKLKTTLQIMYLAAAVLLSATPYEFLLTILKYVSIVVTIYSAYRYTVTFLHHKN